MNSADKPPRFDNSGAVWFEMSVGRNGNADPRWLVPLICRRGHVTKRDIGSIRIFDRETKFEISGHAADRFLAAASRPDDKDEGVRFQPSRGKPPSPGGRGGHPGGFKPPYKKPGAGKPDGAPPRGKWQGKPAAAGAAPNKWAGKKITAGKPLTTREGGRDGSETPRRKRG